MKEGGIISFQKMALAVLLQYDTAEGDRHSCLGISSLEDREKELTVLWSLKLISCADFWAPGVDANQHQVQGFHNSLTPAS